MFYLTFLLSLDSTSEITGMKVVLIAFFKKFPIRLEADKAIKKVSVSIPDPNLAAIRTSLKKPRNLLPRPNIIIVSADLADLFDFDIINTPTLLINV